MNKKVTTGIIFVAGTTLLIWGLTTSLKRQGEEPKAIISGDENLQSLLEERAGLRDVIFNHYHNYNRLDTDFTFKLDREQWRLSQQAAEKAWRQLWIVSEKIEGLEKRGEARNDKSR